MIYKFHKIVLIIFLLLYSNVKMSFASRGENGYVFGEYPVTQTYKITYDNINGAKFSVKSDKKELVFGSSSLGSKSDGLYDNNNSYCGGIFTYNTIRFSSANDRFYERKNDRFMYTICGNNWLVWGNREVANEIEENGGCGGENCTEYENYKKYYPELGDFNGSYKFEVKKCVKNINDCEGVVKLGRCQKGASDLACLPYDGGTSFNMNDRVFRENLYDGEEIINFDCEDPRPEAKEFDIFKDSDKIYQTYYMRGYQAGNYLCDRYLQTNNITDEEEKQKYKDAYSCCKKAERSVCVYQYEKNNIAKFCSIDGSECWLNDVQFQVFASEDNDTSAEQVYCMQTYNYCPYNFNLEFGTEIADKFKQTIDENSVAECEQKDNIEDCNIQYTDNDCEDDEGGIYQNCLGNIENFYQYRRHCTILSVPKEAEFKYYADHAPFIDKSCINFVGSSHNTSDYSDYHEYDQARDLYPHVFSAAGVECFTETLKNFLFNRAGHTKCLNADETPDINDECDSGEIYKRGQELSDFSVKRDDDLFEYPLRNLIDTVRNIVYIFIAFSISLYGYNILIKGGQIGNRTEIVMMLIKISIILSLTTSKVWYDHIFTVSYELTNVLFNTVSKIGFDTTLDANGNFVKDDGCFFNNIDDIVSETDSFDVLETANKYENNHESYPSSRKYVAFFDTLDCKLAKYLSIKEGESDVPQILKMIFASMFFPFNIGIYLSLLSLMCAIIILVFIIKVAYIFVASMAAVTILLFLSPIIIPMILFKKTNGMFGKWLKNLIGFCIQPMILAAYVSIAIMMIDDFMLGEGLYIGKNGIKKKELVCGFACKDAVTGALKSYTTKRTSDAANALEDVKTGDDLTAMQEFNNYFLKSLVVEMLPLDQCTAYDTIIDIKRNSPLCVMDNISTSLLFGIIPIFSDTTFSDVLMFIRVAFLIFILNMILNKVPSIASTLTGSGALPGVSVDVMEIVGKAAAFARGVTRFATGAVNKIIRKSHSKHIHKND